MSIVKIVSGGQTGVDRAALDAAIALNLAHGGWCPHNRRAEDGTIPARYKLIETHDSDYLTRTCWNVRDSDATLIIYTGTLEGGTKKTVQFAKEMNKPLYLLDPDKHIDLSNLTSWIEEENIRILNIAGPRESKETGIYLRAYALIFKLLKEYYC